jgi:hypothetical protein
VNRYLGPAFLGGEGGPKRSTLQVSQESKGRRDVQARLDCLSRKEQKVRSKLPHSEASALTQRAGARNRKALLQLLAPDSRPQLLPYGRNAVAGRPRLRRLLSAELLALRSPR